MSAQFLCRLDEIGPGTARGFVLGDGRDVILVRSKAGVLMAYANSCPHQFVPLETFPDRFLNADATQLICTAHGARFRVDDGLCVSGPCEGKSLTPVAIDVSDGAISLRA